MEQPSIEKVTQLLHQQRFPASIEAALMAIRECDMFSRTDLSMLANRFIFCHSQSPSPSNSSQLIWIKTLNNLQELHTLDMLRQFLEKQSDLKISTRIFDIIFVDILLDPRHPLFSLYQSLMMKFLSLALSFESKQTLTIVAQWFLSLAKNENPLLRQLVEQLIREHFALVMSKSMHNLATASPIFTLCFITQTSILLIEDNCEIDLNTMETLIELFTRSLTDSNPTLLLTLHDELNEKDESLLMKCLSSLLRLDVLLPLRSFDSNLLRSHLNQYHTSLLSFLFSIVMDRSQRADPSRYLPRNFFEELSIMIQEMIEREGPEKSSIDECVQRYLQLVSICKSPSFPLTQIRVCDLGTALPLFTRHRLFDIFKDQEQTETKKK